MVVTGADPVEDGRGDFGSEGLSGFLVHPDEEWVRAPAPTDHEVQFGLVDQHAVLDDVTRRPAVEGEELVSGP
jgi:hypothetical protein